LNAKAEKNKMASSSSFIFRWKKTLFILGVFLLSGLNEACAGVNSGGDAASAGAASKLGNNEVKPL
jgi:hypothetical protein